VRFTLPRWHRPELTLLQRGAAEGIGVANKIWNAARFIFMNGSATKRVFVLTGVGSLAPLLTNESCLKSFG